AQVALRRPWAQPDPALGFEGGIFANMPVGTSYWPVNRYLIHNDIVELEAPRVDKTLADSALSGPPLQFYNRAEAVPDLTAAQAWLENAPAKALDETLLVQAEPGVLS